MNLDLLKAWTRHYSTRLWLRLTTCGRCGWDRGGPHYRFCPVVTQTWGERVLERLDYSTRTARRRCRCCGMKAPNHKMQCVVRNAQMKISMRYTP